MDFCTKSLYRVMVGDRPWVFPHKCIWTIGIPSKVFFFLWTAFLDKILTLDNLQSRGWILANRCCLCYREEETVDHLFVHCALANVIWGFSLSSSDLLVLS